MPAVRRPGNGKWLTVTGACENNLKNIDVAFPLGTLRLRDRRVRLGQVVAGQLDSAQRRRSPSSAAQMPTPGEHADILGAEALDKVIAIDQSPIGRTPRSNPATYTGVFADIRDAVRRHARGEGARL